MSKFLLQAGLQHKPQRDARWGRCCKYAPSALEKGLPGDVHADHVLIRVGIVPSASGTLGTGPPL
ncbi:MAG: hypothetical protein JSV78_02770 [Phycisphaerales bacterium]|nr:MAG: hypothetical protein JSV78_02770 [Phycisphaerales bacterium]